MSYNVLNMSPVLLFNVARRPSIRTLVSNTRIYVCLLQDTLVVLNFQRFCHLLTSTVFLCCPTPHSQPIHPIWMFRHHHYITQVCSSIHIPTAIHASHNVIYRPSMPMLSLQLEGSRYCRHYQTDHPSNSFTESREGDTCMYIR